ncbi:hypothetical protein BKA67DRAFT_532398 [Truncatella angustata]|uniref:Uncharacterized protein n=1 Tax=Truncatella angustata TaxID=152316 RepID=A0A9P9A1H7_9PEZI|nr:uncharacterized protein BKA67DRAFT_532398 [Truncatella angustata]KAH6657171.1 hypothetical protein BKA67DRAFT_532398 [Truncatella angustata]KAH8197591.1 hypothetical protein TruAng_008223 [Truncatella angustata]
MRKYENIWHKRQLVPCWVLQCIAAGIFMIAAGMILAAAAYVKNKDSQLDLSDYNYYGYNASDLVRFAAITGGVIMGFAICTIVFDIVECILYARRVLSPVALLVLACLKFLAWGVYFILAIISATRGSVGWLDILLSLVLVSTSLTQLILGAKYTHLKRKGTLDHRGNYKPAVTGHVEGGVQPGYYAGAQPTYPPSYGQQNPFNDTTYRSTSPAPPGYGQDAVYGNPQHGVEMQPQKPAHY